MGKVRPLGKTLPNSRIVTIIAQDPSVRVRGKILTADVEIPAEELLPGPRGYRVNVIDYDSSTGVLYKPAILASPVEEKSKNRTSAGNGLSDKELVDDPRFHAQNVYAIVMRILARFEFALGRRVAWGSAGHQIHLAPHAFAEANAFYSREDRGIFFGYFRVNSGEPIFTCLSHDVVAHETTHAILDCLRSRYLEPSSPDQAAFHEGFADIVALLSVFSLPDIVGAMLDGQHGAKMIGSKQLTRDALLDSVLLGLADQMGEELSRIRGQALRRSAELAPGKPYMSMPDYQEPHRRGELLVAAIMNTFLDIWLSRLAKVGFVTRGMRDRSLVVEQGALVAGHLLTMAIRAIDYCPPTDLTFSDYLSALLTVDREVVPDDSKFGYRDSLLKNFKAYDISPADDADADGTWKRFDKALTYGRTRFESMLRDKEEVFRFLWENREALEIDEKGYVEVQSVRPCARVGPDGFVLRETVAEYVEILTLTVGELASELQISAPNGMPQSLRVRIFGGGALVFDEYGQVKYQIRNTLEETDRQTKRLKYLWETGYFDRLTDSTSNFAALHLARAMDQEAADVPHP
jgi:hypothetical protein